MKKLIAVILLITTVWATACMSGVAEKEDVKKPESSSEEASSSGNDQDRGTASLDMEGGKISIDYGRPTLRGRDILSLLVPGEEWRMGMNDATTLTSDLDLKLGDKTVSKGKYVLTAKRVDDKIWHLLIKSEDGSTVADVPLTFQNVTESVEQMTIVLDKTENGGKFTLHWGTFTLTTNFQKA